jgi:uncharacterized protein
MKASRYNWFFKAENDGRWLAFNGMTGALAAFNNEAKYSVARQILTDPDQVDQAAPMVQELWDKLVKGGYLVEDWVDEIAVLKVRNRTARFRGRGLSLTIAPTMGCNFKCTYCYETHPSGVMSTDVEDALVEMIRERLKSKDNLSVIWFGGEPLLRLEQILRLTERFDEICQEKESPYIASVITNGYLLDEQVVSQLRLAHVRSAQITLDGPKKVHDQRRLLHNGQGTYDRIMANVAALVDSNGCTEEKCQRFAVSIRVNVDKTNAAEIPKLLDDLESRGLKDKVGLYLGQVKPYTEVCRNIGGSCLSDQEYTTTEVELYRQFLSKGFRVAKYPTIRSAYCGADASQHSFVVGPGGELYACLSEVGGSNTIGHLLKKQEGRYNRRLIEFLSWDPFERQECRECEILPICMGGCPYQSFQAGPTERGVCEPWKDNLIEILQLFYTSARTRASQV